LFELVLREKWRQKKAKIVPGHKGQLLFEKLFVTIIHWRGAAPQDLPARGMMPLDPQYLPMSTKSGKGVAYIEKGVGESFM